MNEVIGQLRAGTGIVTSVLRVVTGVLLAWHGWRKFDDGIEGFEGFLDFLGLPAPGLLAVVVALLELVGGILLAIGLFSRLVALLFVVEFAAIFFWVKLIKLDPVLLVGGESPGVELDLIYLASAIFFLVAGPGAIAADRVFGLEPEPEPLADSAPAMEPAHA
ncbi:MAG: DoxX family protein [Actinomycetota bacterium]